MTMCERKLKLNRFVKCPFDGLLQGCQGGLATDAFQYVEDNDGIESEADNPYTAGDGDDSAACVEDGNYVATVNGTWDVEEGDEDDLKEAVAQQVGVNMLIIVL